MNFAQYFFFSIFIQYGNYSALLSTLIVFFDKNIFSFENFIRDI